MNKNIIKLSRRIKRTSERRGCPELHGSGVRESHWWLVSNVPSEVSIILQ
jgi:hypothetical protein